MPPTSPAGEDELEAERGVALQRTGEELDRRHSLPGRQQCSAEPNWLLRFVVTSGFDLLVVEPETADADISGLGSRGSILPLGPRKLQGIRYESRQDDYGCGCSSRLQYLACAVIRSREQKCRVCQP